MLSATYYIERHGPCDAGGLHHGGFPKMRTFRTCSPSPSGFLTFSIERRSERPLACTDYGFDHTSGKFACYSTKATIILSDMSTMANGRAYSDTKHPDTKHSDCPSQPATS